MLLHVVREWVLHYGNENSHEMNTNNVPKNTPNKYILVKMYLKPLCIIMQYNGVWKHNAL